jgi:acyl-coenzyme A synthetase/AMP-(fatty) acid ligase
LGASLAVESVDDVGVGRAIAEWAANTPVGKTVAERPPSELALILYTSGSTGRHKGWMMTRAAIEAHARWCHQLLRPDARDVFANHAPFSFGMSLFDIYSSLGCGAALVLVPDEIRAFPAHVADLLSRERVSIWFSAPAILSLIGALDDVEARDLSALRVVAFAGEVFPAPRLQPLRRRLRQPRYFNFYGSTETNVAAFYELLAGTEFDAPPPIGRPCTHYEARVVAPDGALAAAGAVGELQFRGVGLTTGYINQPELTAERIIASTDGGLPWYRTCDLAVSEASGDLRYIGRIGRMVKLRGYRVEPGEIEARLYQNPYIKEAAVVPVEGARGLQLVAHVSGERRPVVELKAFCSTKLPPYMIPERFVFHTARPRTARGKIDFDALRNQSET